MNLILAILAFAINVYFSYQCPPDFVQDSNDIRFCYKYYAAGDTWYYAAKICDAFNTGDSGDSYSLPHFDDQSEYSCFLNFVRTFYPSTCGIESWIGVQSDGTDLLSVDGANIDFELWDPTNNNMGGNTCLFHTLTTGGKWTKANCTDKRTYFCQLRQDIGGPDDYYYDDDIKQSEGCLNGWHSDKNGLCYRSTNDFGDWGLAKVFCSSSVDGATLPVFCDEAEMNAYRALLPKLLVGCNEYLWVGFNDDFGNCSYTWIDGRPVPNNTLWTNNVMQCSPSSCGTSTPWKNVTTLSQNFCSFDLPFVCQYRPNGTKCSNVTTTSTISATITETSSPPKKINMSIVNNCNDLNSQLNVYWRNEYPNICYLFANPNSKNWADATAYCQNLPINSTLPVFYDKQEYNSYSRLMVGINHMTCNTITWLGLKQLNKTYVNWVDGSPVTFTLWDNGQPSSFGICGTHSYQGGFWRTGYSCSGNQFVTVCQIRLNSTITSNTPSSQANATSPTACPTGWISDSLGICYIQWNTSTYWSTAEQLCESLCAGSTLPVLYNASEFDAYRELIWTTYYTACDVSTWLGFSYSNASSDFRWINTNQAVNHNWKSGYPQSINTRQCGKFYQWFNPTLYNEQCNVSKSFFCQLRHAKICQNISTTTSLHVSTSTSLSSKVTTNEALSLALSVSNATTLITKPMALSTALYVSNASATTTKIPGLSTGTYMSNTTAAQSSKVITTLNSAKVILTTSISSQNSAKIFNCDTKMPDITKFYKFKNLFSGKLATWNYGLVKSSSNEPDNYEPLVQNDDYNNISQHWYFVPVDNENTSFYIYNRESKNVLIYLKDPNCSYIYEKQCHLKNQAFHFVSAGGSCFITTSDAPTLYLSNVNCGNTNIRMVDSSFTTASVCEKWVIEEADSIPQNFVQSVCTINADPYACPLQPDPRKFYKIIFLRNQKFLDVTNESLVSKITLLQNDQTDHPSQEWFFEIVDIANKYIRIYNRNSRLAMSWTSKSVYQETTDCNSTYQIFRLLKNTDGACSLSMPGHDAWLLTASWGCRMIANNPAVVYSTLGYNYPALDCQQLVLQESDIIPDNFNFTFCNSASTSTATTVRTTTTNIQTTNFLATKKDTVKAYDSTKIITESGTVFTPTQVTSESVTLTSLMTSLDIKKPSSFGGDIEVTSAIRDSLPFVFNTLNDSVKQMLGYSLPQMVTNCWFNNVPCDLQNDFQWIYDPSLGSCFTYNPGLQIKHWSSQAGSTYGLRMVLANSQDEYPCSSLIAGYKIVVHENNLLPFPDTEGYMIPYGVANSFGIYQKKFSRLNSPYGKCALVDHGAFIKNYSVEACQKLCFQNQLLNICKCADPRYLLPQNAIYCGPEQKICLDYNKMCETNLLNNCDCPAPCNEIIYYGTLTTAKLMQTNVSLTSPFCQDEGNSSNCDGGFSLLYIYYDQLQQLVLTETSSYELSQLFSDFNGLAGALLGIGVLTFVEILVIAFLFIENLFTKAIEMKS